MGKHIIEEAQRCLQCKNPQCQKGCPAGTPIKEMIASMLGGDMLNAGERLFMNNPLSVICSLICPHEKFCEGHCILGRKQSPVQISSIENYISSYFLDQVRLTPTPSTGKMVAVIGSGPAGITVAFMLAQRGYGVTIFESSERIGGVLQYGIPEYRLPKSILRKIEEMLVSIGVKIRPNIRIGPVLTIDDLFRDGYQSVFIGTGVWNPRPLRIPGESLGHVHYAINYLKNPDVYSLGRRVCVIGAGNVAMDVARTALRKGVREVYVLYRRGEADISATHYEYEYARIEGVRFEFFKSPTAIVPEGVRYVETEMRPCEDGTETLYCVEERTGLFAADSVIIAASQSPANTLVSSTPNLQTNSSGLLLTGEDGQTSVPGIYASGDVVTGAKTVVEAVRFSKKAAEAMVKYMEREAKGSGEDSPLVFYPENPAIKNKKI
jgi:glutamate synthase (NADPH/NADH) small chain